MLQGVGVRGAERRPERCVELTDEFVKTLPDPLSYGDVFWDTVCPRLTVIKGRKGILYRMKLRKSERKTLGIGTTTALHRLGGYDLSVEEARARYREIEQAIKNGDRLYPGDVTKEVSGLLEDAPGDGERSYEALMSVLMDAYAQAANTGEDRSNGQPFEKQGMQKIMRATSIDYGIGRAMTKMLESRRLKTRTEKRAELLGAIVYAAGAVVALDLQTSSEVPVGGDTPDDAA